MHKPCPIEGKKPWTTDQQTQARDWVRDTLQEAVAAGHPIIFADGSCLGRAPAPTSAAFTLRVPPPSTDIPPVLNWELHKGILPLSQHGHCNTAELHAITEAICMVHRTGMRDVTVRFFTDSKNAANLLCDNYPSTSAAATTVIDKLCNTLRCLRDLSVTVLVHWIPGHCNIPLHDEVDILAKQAATEASQNDSLCTEAPTLATARAIIKARVVMKWQERWIGSGKGRQLFHLLPCVIRKHNHLWTGPRKLAVVRCQLRHDHSTLNESQFKLGRTQSPQCGLANCEAMETREHFLYYCDVFSNIREDLQNTLDDVPDFNLEDLTY